MNHIVEALGRIASKAFRWIQWGTQTVPNPAVLSVGGIENWVTNGAPLSLVPGNRVPLTLPPAVPGGVAYSAQVVCSLQSPLVPVDPLTCTVPVGNFAATPAIVFSY